MRKIFTLFFLLTGTIILAQTTYHVKIGGDDTKDGKSWNNAFATIQKALSVSTNTGDEIAVAKGTYYPDEGTGTTDNDRESKFFIDNSVNIFGGYEGVEGVYNRDWVLNPTILSADLNQDNTSSVNAYIIIEARNRPNLNTGIPDRTIFGLDGFTLTGAHSLGASPDLGSAGAIENFNTNMTVRNCNFIRNSAYVGGAIQNVDVDALPAANIILYNCNFTGNIARTGGAIFNGRTSPTIGDCRFTNNIAQAGNNQEGGEGGAIFNSGNEGNASPTISNCIFTGNTGYGIVVNKSGSGNTSPTFFNCSFANNGPLIIIYNNGRDGNASPTFYNCSISNFSASDQSAIYNDGFTGIVNLTLINCIIWNNSQFQITNHQGAITTSSYSIIKGAFINSSWNTGLGADGGHNLDVDPRFVDAANGNLRLQTCSPAIDAGNTSVLKVSPDLGGNNRVVNSIIDMGPYETPAGLDIYPPTVKTKNISVGLNANGLASIIAINVNDGSTDNCGILSMSVSPSSFNCSNIGPNTVTLTVNDINGNSATGQATVTIVDDIVPNAICRNITVQSDANGNASITPAQIDNGSTDVCGIAFRTVSKTIFNCSNVGANVVTFTVTDNNGNASTCTATVTVEDKVPPIALCRNITVELDANGSVTITSSQIDNGSNDACGIKSLSLSKTTFDCTNVGANEVTLTVTDNNNNVSICTATVTVEDNMAPVISGMSANPEVLSPPNHQMKDVLINYTSTDNCPGRVCVISNISSNEPVDGSGDGTTSPDWEYVDASHVRLRAERSANGSGRIYTITITCTDASGNSSTATQQVRVTHNIKNPHSGQAFKIGSTVNFSGEFWDKPGNTHTGKWLIDYSTIINGIVTEPSGNQNGQVTGSYKFNNAGVYKLQMNTVNQNGVLTYANTNGDLDAIVVIYDPNGGYTYGGGWYPSQAGALIGNSSATGKASYGFTVNYPKNATKPKGETQFEFKVGTFEFNALTFDYLVISNSMAQFKGTGKIIGGQSGIGFTMTVTDGQLDGSGVDKIRMKIYNKNNGKVIYDNQPGASDAALPTQTVGANSTVVISGTNSSLTSANTNQKAEMEASAEKVPDGLDVIAFPNPSTNNFAINVKTNKTDKITMQVVDMYGRIIETRNVTANSPIRFGDRYNPGTYFVRILQGKEHKEIKLIKLSD